MPHVDLLPRDARVLDFLKAFPDAARPLLDLHQVIMRDDSPLSHADREVIAMFVSGLNQCSYCAGVHGRTADAIGTDSELLTGLQSGQDDDAVPPKYRPLLELVRKVTQESYRVTAQDVAEVRQVGWSEQAVVHAVLVCALFSFMNRVVDGLGIMADDAYFRQAAQRLASSGYSSLKEQL